MREGKLSAELPLGIGESSALCEVETSPPSDSEVPQRSDLAPSTDEVERRQRSSCFRFAFTLAACALALTVLADNEHHHDDHPLFIRSDGSSLYHIEHCGGPLLIEVCQTYGPPSDTSVRHRWPHVDTDPQNPENVEVFPLPLVAAC